MEVHRHLIQQYVAEPREYVRAFDLFEYLVLLACLQLNEEEKPPKRFSLLPLRCVFQWQAGDEGVIAEQEQERTSKGGYWLSSKLGFFDGRTERLHAAQLRLLEVLKP
jgi:hypothetical protein